MLVEFLDRVVALAEERLAPVLLRAPEEPAHIYHVSNPRRGTLERQRALPPTRQHQAGSLETLLAYILEERRHQEEAWQPVLWYSRQGVVLLVDDQDRRDRVGLGLSLSPQFRRLQTLDAGPIVWHDQKGFIALLRIALAGCLGTAGDLLGVVRQVKFRQLAEAQGVLQHGKASLGKAIEAQLEGAVNLPEQVVLAVPVFGNLVLPLQQVVCAIEVDPSLEKLALVPLPGSLEMALQGAEAVLGQRLRDGLGQAGVPTYYGQA